MASTVILDSFPAKRQWLQRGTRPKHSSELKQARDLQQLAHETAVSLRQDLVSSSDHNARKSVAVALRMAIMAWDAASERVRIARNKPLPGSLRPEAKPRKKPKSQQSTFAEIPPAVPVPSTSGPTTPETK